MYKTIKDQHRKGLISYLIRKVKNKVFRFYHRNLIYINHYILNNTGGIK